MILLDTNVLVYAVGSSHPLREPSRRLLRAVQTAPVPITTTVPVIQEFLYVFARSRPREQAAAAGRWYIDALGPLIEAGPDDLGVAVGLFERHSELEALDALLAAIALNEEADALVSADLAFACVPGLLALDPRSPELAAMLG